MIKSVRIVGAREFTSKSGKACKMLSWLEKYDSSVGSGYQAFTSFTDAETYLAYKEFNPNTDVQAFVFHQGNTHQISNVR